MAVEKKFQPWPEANIPYINQNTKYPQQIKNAIMAWENHTVIRFVPQTTQTAYVQITSSTTKGSNTDHFGYQPDRVTKINLAQGFLAAHELGHAIGLIHEHTRSDRDTYVKIHFENIEKGKKHNFVRVANSQNLGLRYNQDSIMHYGVTWQHKDSGHRKVIQWLGNSKFGIHNINGKEIGWEDPRVSDYKSVNRAYLEVVPGAFLFFAMIGTFLKQEMTIMMSCNATANQGVNILWDNREEIYEGEIGIDGPFWLTEFTLYATHVCSGSSMLTAYSPEAATIDLFEIDQWGRLVKPVWTNTSWTKGYSIMVPCPIGEDAYLLSYVSESGYLKLNQVTSTEIDSKSFSENWTENYTILSAFVLQDSTYLFSYKNSDGLVKIHSITTAAVGDEVFSDTWADDFDIVVSCEIGGDPYLICYRNSGIIYLYEVVQSNNGLDLKNVYEDSWSKGYTSMTCMNINGSTVLASYESASGKLKLNPVDSSGIQGHTYESTMQEGFWAMLSAPIS